MGLYVNSDTKTLGLVLQFVKRADLFKFLDDGEGEENGVKRKNKAQKYRQRDPEMWEALQRISFKVFLFSLFLLFICF